MNMTANEISQWADSRETSTEIAIQIIAIARDNIHAGEIWDDPTSREEYVVMSRAWANTDEDELFWGAETLPRPSYSRIIRQMAAGMAPIEAP